MHARTLISPNWRTRGRIASDAMVLMRMGTDDGSQQSKEGRGGMMAVKSQPGELRPKLGVFKCPAS